MKHLLFTLLFALLLVACSTAEPETAPPSAEPITVAVPTTESAQTVADDDDDVYPAERVDREFLTGDDRPSFLKSQTSTWDTDWTTHTIPYDSILSGGVPRDGIPSIDNPQFISALDANEWLADNEPVVSVVIDGEARAYPLQILTQHEIVNDMIGDTPVLVTFCPLCNSAIVFNRQVGDEAYEFGVSGLLRNSDLIMYDRTTETLWQQFTGEGVVGEHSAVRLDFLSSSLIGYGHFKDAHPDGVVLSTDTGFARKYGQNPYVGYDTSATPFLFDGALDGRLNPTERVVSVTFHEEELYIAYPVTPLSAQGVVNDTQGNHQIVIFHLQGTASALDGAIIANSKDVGSTAAFDAVLDGRLLTFVREGNVFIDTQTSSTWNIAGMATSGELAGSQLTPLVHADHFWFSWAAFRPDTVLYEYDQ